MVTTYHSNLANETFANQISIYHFLNVVNIDIKTNFCEKCCLQISFYLRPLTKLMILFPTDMHTELCRRITYTAFDHGRIITHQGRKPQRFYFVLDGKGTEFHHSECLHYLITLQYSLNFPLL